MLGREVHQPQDVAFKPAVTLRNTANPADYVCELSKNMEAAESIARKHLRAAQENQKRMYDTKVLERPYHVGDLVYVLNTARKKGKCPKLQSIRKGPFVVTKVYGPVVYEVQNNSCTKTLHHNKLKPYSAEAIPAWVNRLIEQVRCRPNNDCQSKGHQLEDEHSAPMVSDENLTISESSLRIPSGGLQSTAAKELSSSESSLRIQSGGLQSTTVQDPTPSESSLRIPAEDALDVSNEQDTRVLIDPDFPELTQTSPGDHGGRVSNPRGSSLRIPDGNPTFSRYGRQRKPRKILDL